MTTTPTDFGSGALEMSLSGVTAGIVRLVTAVQVHGKFGGARNSLKVGAEDADLKR